MFLFVLVRSHIRLNLITAPLLRRSAVGPKQLNRRVSFLCTLMLFHLSRIGVRIDFSNNIFGFIVLLW